MEGSILKETFCIGMAAFILAKGFCLPNRGHDAYYQLDIIGVGALCVKRRNF